MSVSVLGPVRHACLRCGGSCQGAVVVLHPAERDAVAEAARRLGVDAVDGDHLRQTGGRCVLLRDDGACRLHAELGPDHKPRVCRQFPIVAVRVGDEVRVGVDPGCYTHARTWQEGPEVAADQLAVARAPLDPAEVAAEEAVLDLLAAPRQTVVGALDRLAAPGWPGRLIRQLQQADLARHVAHPDTPPMLRATVGPIVAAARAWRPDPPPPLVLADADERFALDAVRRAVFLRLHPELPVAGAALLGLAGAVLAGWTVASQPDRFGPLLAGWTRAVRSPSVLDALLPEPTSLRWLATGR